MKARFLGQPLEDLGSLLGFFESVSDDSELVRLRIVVAWAKQSGLTRTRKHLEKLRAQNTATSLLVGIDEGGATVEGLTLAMELFDTVHVFHDRSSRTFHPKIYWASTVAEIEAATAGRVELLVGSGNLTAGGVYYNYEAALHCELDLADAEDRELALEVDRYIKLLYDDEEICIELDEDVFNELATNPKYRVRPEAQSRKAAVPDADTPENVDAVGTDDATEAESHIFGKSKHKKLKAPPTTAGVAAALPPPAPPLTGTTPPATAPPTAPATTPTTAPGAGTPASPAAPVAAAPTGGAHLTIVRRWFKQLAASDAQRPPRQTTNPTGVLRLNQAGLPIDQRVWFRHDMFGALPWAADGDRETTDVPFLVTVDGQFTDVPHTIVVSHKASRESGQNNVTTVLHWGPLATALAAHNFTNEWVVLERVSDGSYRLRLTNTPLAAAQFV